MEAFIIANDRNEISLANLTDVPPFLRFNAIKIYYGDYEEGRKTIEENCQFVGNFLEPLKDALKDSKSIRFFGCINRNGNKSFGNYSALLNYLSESILPIFDSSRRYEFRIGFCSDGEFATTVTSSIMEMSQIKQCSNLKIELRTSFLADPKQLPLEAISNWLNRKIDYGMKFIARSPQEIFLKIYMTFIQNAMEICDQITKVTRFNFKSLFLFDFSFNYYINEEINLFFPKLCH